MSVQNCSVLLGAALKNPPKAAYFLNTTQSSTQTGTANSTGPLPGFGATSSSGDTTLISAFDKGSSTFTAPYNGMFKLVGWQQWLYGNQNYVYYLYIKTNASNSDFQSGGMAVGITPIMHEIYLSKGQTLQIQGSSSAAWGTFQNSLTIYANQSI